MSSFVSAPAFHASVYPYLIPYAEGDKSFITVRVRLHCSLNARKVYVRAAPEGEELAYEAKPLNSEEGLDPVGRPLHKDWLWWEASLPATVPHLTYRFYIMTEQGNYSLNGKGFVRYTPLDRDDFKYNLLDNPPAWVKDSVFFQIFPDRFRNGDDSLSVKDGEYELYGEPVVACAWDAPLDLTKGNRLFYNGDLRGIAEKLDYIKDLGVNALYINPIFCAPSNHKYDVTDYFKVDPHLGGDEALAELRRKTRDMGIRIVLDTVPNHCGCEHHWFKKAQSDKNSEEYNYFTFYEDDPNNYEMWLGVKTLPRLNYRCQALRGQIYDSPDSTMCYWLREPYAIDGWRLDVANMLARQNMHQLGHEVGKGMRRAVKAQNPEAWLVGENFHDPTDYQQGDEFDASMNYRGFTFPVTQWMAGRDNNAFNGSDRGDGGFLPTEDLLEQLQSFRVAVPESIALNMLNLLSSHDIPRVKTLNYGRADKTKVLYTFMFAYQGAPCVYYGDEIGLEGGKDPDCRRPMIWDESRWDKDMREHIKLLCKVRNENEALRRGSLQWLQGWGSSLAFIRDDGNTRAICAVTRDLGREEPEFKVDRLEFAPMDVSSAAIPEGTKFRGVVSGREASVLGGLLCASPCSLGAEIWIEVK
ncbi:maltodextrin glucosidase [bacterium]|nr:maltodextrin glucosidase [bacterium]